MDFPDLIKETHDGITFKLSSLFSYSYGDGYTLQDYATSRVVYDLDVYFSVETFTDKDAEIIKFAFEEDEEVDNLTAVHRYYIYKRAESVYEPFISEVKTLPKSMNIKGYIQVVEGKTYDYDDSLTYFTATLEVDDKIYVFQLIGKSGNMDYLYDDFLTILNSVH